jgi:hypothetical protein
MNNFGLKRPRIGFWYFLGRFVGECVCSLFYYFRIQNSGKITRKSYHKYINLNIDNLLRIFTFMERPIIESQATIKHQIARLKCAEVTSIILWLPQELLKQNVILI